MHVSENGQDVLVMEMVGGKLHVTAGTCEKLFLKLADETAQGNGADTLISNSICTLTRMIVRSRLR